MKGQGMLISAFAFALIIAIFAVINVEPVQVNFLFAQTSTPLILVILVSTLLGGLTVGLFGMIRIFRLQRTVKALEKRTAELSAEVEPFETYHAMDHAAASKESEAQAEAVPAGGDREFK
ncbi:DUF1049 domain-containing protein [Paenibacillus nanensis]|uniref:DUF1049 domain-containing protein n=1 Tax=Paenibacillus nanensis TaxID=393251 RepID=A0A3A1UQ17_9BACL|nr:lipopolysaccharide assembly protein LapA domain-containing protein [Paenibacillus nanensis]RIX49417.1 DUF1049 domain-containing protein [Paenibacillus nanensis]